MVMNTKVASKNSDTATKSSTENAFKPFQPEMPRIPGVSDGSRHARRGLNNSNNNLLPKIGAFVVAVLCISLTYFWWSKHKSRGANRPPFDPEIAEETAPALDVPKPLPPVREGPSVAGSVEELSKTWSVKEFTFVKPITHENIDAMVVRLPGGQLWGFSLQDPYGRCKLEFIADLAMIEGKYRFKASHPMVVNPCDSTVFDPLKVGALGGNTWARGQIVQGEGLRPPISIDVKVQGRSIIAENIE